MTIEELEQIVAKAEGHQQTEVLLVVNRKRAPGGCQVLVRGMGLGYIVNVQCREDGSYNVVAFFQLKSIKRYLRLAKAEQDARTGTAPAQPGDDA